MLAHQLGRRNLTPKQVSYLRGKEYQTKKQTSRGGGERYAAQGQTIAAAIGLPPTTVVAQTEGKISKKDMKDMAQDCECFEGSKQ